MQVWRTGYLTLKSTYGKLFLCSPFARGQVTTICTLRTADRRMRQRSRLGHSPWIIPGSSTQCRTYHKKCAIHFSRNKAMFSFYTSWDKGDFPRKLPPILCWPKLLAPPFLTQYPSWRLMQDWLYICHQAIYLETSMLPVSTGHRCRKQLLRTLYDHKSQSFFSKLSLSFLYRIIRPRD